MKCFQLSRRTAEFLFRLLTGRQRQTGACTHRVREAAEHMVAPGGVMYRFLTTPGAAEPEPLGGAVTEPAQTRVVPQPQQYNPGGKDSNDAKDSDTRRGRQMGAAQAKKRPASREQQTTPETTGEAKRWKPVLQMPAESAEGKAGRPGSSGDVAPPGLAG